MERLVTQRERIADRLSIRDPMTLGEATELRRRIIADGYRKAETEIATIASAIRAHNELVNNILWAILGIAESEELPEFELEAVESVRVRHRGRAFRVHFAVWEPRTLIFSQPPSPFLLRLGTPLDGVYLTERQIFAWSGRELVDVHGRAFQALERAPMD